MRSKEELSSEYNDSNPFAMFTDNPSSGKSAAKPTCGDRRSRSKSFRPSSLRRHPLLHWRHSG
eukprot:UN07532